MDRVRMVMAVMLKALSAHFSRKGMGRPEAGPFVPGLFRWAGAGAATGSVFRVIAASPEGCLVGPACYPVEGQQQHEVEDGIEQANGGRIAELRLLEACVVDVRLDDFRRRQVQVGL